MPTEEELLKDALAGSSNLPDSAAYNKQRALKGIGFDWKPSDEQTKRDIQEADRRDKLIRMALEATRKPVVESKPLEGMDALLEGIKWNLGGRKGPGPKDKGYRGSPSIGASLRKLIMPEKEVPPDPFDVKANAAVPVSFGDVIPEYVERKTGSAVAGMAAGILTPSPKIGVGKNLRKMMDDAEGPIVQTGRHTQSEGVSDEVINWLQSRKEQGITRWVVRKDGSVTPLTGVNSRDYRVPDDAVLVDVQKGKPQILDTGSGVPKAHVEGILARAAKNFKEANAPAAVEAFDDVSKQNKLLVESKFTLAETKPIPNPTTPRDLEYNRIVNAIEGAQTRLLAARRGLKDQLARGGSNGFYEQQIEAYQVGLEKNLKRLDDFKK